MNTKARPSLSPIYLLPICMLLLATLACSLSDLKVKNTTVDITLTQDQVNAIFQNIHIDDPLPGRISARVDRVEMQNGFIRVFGAEVASGGKEANGSFDVSVGAEKDALTARITRVDFPGVSLNDPWIVQVNQQLEASLSRSVADTNGRVLVKSAVVKDGILTITVQLNIQ